MTRQEMTMFYRILITAPDGVEDRPLTEPETKETCERWIRENADVYPAGTKFSLELEDL